MYVCVCNAVTEKQIFNAVKKGAKTVKHLKDTLGVASECTSCVGCAKSCLKAAHETLKQQQHQKPTFMPVQLQPSTMSCIA